MEKGKAKVIIALVFIAFLAIGWFLSSRYLISKLDGTGRVEYRAPWRDEPVEILFVGDIMLDRAVRSTIEREGFDHVFEGVRHIFDGADLTIGNLEGTITSNDSVSQRDNSILRFTFPIDSARMLKNLGFDGFSLANNHAYDFGIEGFEETQAHLGDSKLFVFGSPDNTGRLSHEAMVNDARICFVGYHQLFRSDISSVLSEISRLAPDCYVAVVAHWGSEYEDKPLESVREIARKFVDSGASLIIGAHPHVIQPVEVYGGKAIFYSLGNFVFDQDFSMETRQGLAVRLELTDKKQKFNLIGIEMQRSKLYFPEKESIQPRFDVLISELPEDLRERADVDGVLELPR